ncbi:9744_t:CDS:2 [Gigaspora rosea]|nr:9744_t:CDS:2 [Gigaspora rosea]
MSVVTLMGIGSKKNNIRHPSIIGHSRRNERPIRIIDDSRFGAEDDGLRTVDVNSRVAVT